MLLLILIFHFLEFIIIDDDPAADQSDLLQQTDHSVYSCETYAGILLPGLAADLLDRYTLSVQDYVQNLASLMGDPAAFRAQSFYDQSFGALIRFYPLNFCSVCVHVHQPASV